MKFDGLSRMDRNQVNDILTNREVARQKSLQQRLEQLVAVHRQLLRKFASLELETNELKKKTILRDERIRQLESNAGTLIGNIRHQAENHVAELANIKEAIQVLKNEYDHRLDDLRRLNEDTSSPSSNKGNIKVVVQPKSLRGGGGRSFYQESPRTMTSILEEEPSATSLFFPSTTPTRARAAATVVGSGSAGSSSFNLSRVLGKK